MQVLFCDIESISPPRAPVAALNGEEKGGLPIEAFSMVKELFSGIEWLEGGEDAALLLLKELSENSFQGKLQKLVLSDMRNRAGSQFPVTSPMDSDEEKDSSTSDSVSTNVISEEHETSNEDGDSIGNFPAWNILFGLLQ